MTVPIMARIMDRLTGPVDRLMRPALEFVRPKLAWLPRPLDPFRSIKLKLSILLGVSGLAGITVFYFGIGWIAWRTGFVASGVGLLILQFFAHGMTRPLREMTSAARTMARGDYSIRVRASSHDEVGKLADAFNVMAAELSAADQQRRELIANVSHELRTPITALQGLLENMVDGVSEADPETMRTALAQTERLGRLVTELLDLSKVDAGATTLDLEEIDVVSFLGAVVAEARLNSPVTRFHVDATALTITADPERLHQVFANLLENAARHSPPDGLVTVSASGVGTVTVFEVTDEGAGIPAELRERVFERFFVGDPSARDGGTGLGLAIARWVTQMHQGTITVTDPPHGTGCRIRLTLPSLSPQNGGHDDGHCVPSERVDTRH